MSPRPQKRPEIIVVSSTAVAPEEERAALGAAFAFVFERYREKNPELFVKEDGPNTVSSRMRVEGPKGSKHESTPG